MSTMIGIGVEDWPSAEAWRQILGSVADELIDQAHSEIAAGLEPVKRGQPAWAEWAEQQGD
jgi:hypothetical protein